MWNPPPPTPHPPKCRSYFRRRFYRWARLIRWQPGSVGQENLHEKKMTEISTSGISPTLSISTISYAKLRGRKKRVGGFSSGVDPPALGWRLSACLFRHGNVNLRVLFGCLLWLRHIRVSPGLWAIEWITDSLSTELCGYRAPLVFTAFPLCQLQRQAPRCESVGPCGFCCVRECLCAAERRVQSGCTKGMADLVFPLWHFSKKVEAKWLATQFTDLNFTTRQGITLKDTAAVYSPVYGRKTAITTMSFCSTFLSTAPTAVSH